MPTGSVTVSGAVEGLLTGSKTLGPITISSSNAVALTEDVALVVGNNSINIPTGTTAMVIIPQSGNTQPMILKGAGGDTGINISKFNPTVVAFDTTPPATFTITLPGPSASSAEILFV